MRNIVEPFSPEVTKSCDRKRPCLEAVLTGSSSTVVAWLPDVTGVPLGVLNTRIDLGVFSRTSVFYFLFLTLVIYTFPCHFIFIITLFIPIIAFLANVCHHHHLSRTSASYYRFLALSLVIFPPFYFHNYIIYLGGGGREGGGLFWCLPTQTQKTWKWVSRKSMKVLTNPDTEEMEMCFPEHSSFHLGGNLYLIAEQNGILLTRIP